MQIKHQPQIMCDPSNTNYGTRNGHRIKTGLPLTISSFDQQAKHADWHGVMTCVFAARSTSSSVSALKHRPQYVLRAAAAAGSARSSSSFRARSIASSMRAALSRLGGDGGPTTPRPYCCTTHSTQWKPDCHITCCVLVTKSDLNRNPIHRAPELSLEAGQKSDDVCDSFSIIKYSHSQTEVTDAREQKVHIYVFKRLAGLRQDRPDERMANSRL